MKYIIANWKMNMSFEDMVAWADGFSGFLKFVSPETEVILAPSFVFIPLAYEMAKVSTIKVASQDVSVEEKGAHTGELGAFQIKSLNNIKTVPGFFDWISQFLLTQHFLGKNGRTVVSQEFIYFLAYCRHVVIGDG